VTSEFTKILDNNIYSRKAVAEARNAFKEYCSVKATPETDNQVKLLIFVGPNHLERSNEVVLEFLNYALDRSIQIHIEATE